MFNRGTNIGRDMLSWTDAELQRVADHPPTRWTSGIFGSYVYRGCLLTVRYGDEEIARQKCSTNYSYSSTVMHHQRLYGRYDRIGKHFAGRMEQVGRMLSQRAREVLARRNIAKYAEQAPHYSLQ